MERPPKYQTLHSWPRRFFLLLYSSSNTPSYAEISFFIMELRFILFFPCLWNIPKGKLMGTCYRISLLIVLHTHSCFSWIFGFFLAALCFMNILDLITVLFTQLLWFNIHTLMSRLSLSRICCKPYFSFLVHFLFFEVQFFLYIRLSNAIYPKVVFFLFICFSFWFLLCFFFGYTR